MERVSTILKSAIKGDIIKQDIPTVMINLIQFGRRSFVKYVDISMVHTIITDNRVDKKIVQKLEYKGLEVIIA